MEMGEQDGGAAGGTPSLRAPWHFHSACWAPEGHWTPSPCPCSVLLCGLSCWRRRGRGASSSCRQRLPLVCGSQGTVHGSHHRGLAGRRPGRRRGVSAVATCWLGGQRRWDGGGSAGRPGHPSWPGFGAGCLLRGRRGGSQGPGLGHGWRWHGGSGWSRALAWKESWGGLGSASPGSPPGAEGAAMPAMGQAGGCRQIDGQAAPCPAPMLES